MSNKKVNVKSGKESGKTADKPENKDIKNKKEIDSDQNNDKADVTVGDNGEDQGVENATAKETQLQTADEKLAEVTDRYIRLSAEFDNYRKRTLKEKIDLSKSAGEDLLRRILPVMDDFERALKVMENANDCKALKDGIDLIYNKFGEFLRQNGVREIDAIGKEFDVEVHEAITKIPSPDASQKGKVIDVVEKGYYLHDKIMRFPKVVVGD